MSKTCNFNYECDKSLRLRKNVLRFGSPSDTFLTTVLKTLSKILNLLTKISD